MVEVKVVIEGLVKEDIKGLYGFEVSLPLYTKEKLKWLYRGPLFEGGSYKSMSVTLHVG